MHLLSFWPVSRAAGEAELKISVWDPTKRTLEVSASVPWPLVEEYFVKVGQFSFGEKAWLSGTGFPAQIPVRTLLTEAHYQATCLTLLEETKVVPFTLPRLTISSPEHLQILMYAQWPTSIRCQFQEHACRFTLSHTYSLQLMLQGSADHLVPVREVVLSASGKHVVVAYDQDTIGIFDLSCQAIATQ